MCVLICANARVREWLDMPLARAYRQTLQLCPVCSISTSAKALQERDDLPSPTGDGFELDELTQRRVMKRSAWVQAYCKYHAHADHGMRRAEIGGSSKDWHKALETIAKTWGRLLSLVGLRW